MDPIVMTVVGIFILILILRMFFGVAKMFLKLGLVIVIAVVIWRVFFVKG